MCGDNEKETQTKLASRQRHFEPVLTKLSGQTSRKAERRISTQKLGGVCLIYMDADQVVDGSMRLYHESLESRMSDMVNRRDQDAFTQYLY